MYNILSISLRMNYSSARVASHHRKSARVPSPPTYLPSPRPLQTHYIAAAIYILVNKKLFFFLLWEEKEMFRMAVWQWRIKIVGARARHYAERERDRRGLHLYRCIRNVHRCSKLIHKRERIDTYKNGEEKKIENRKETCEILYPYPSIHPPDDLFFLF